MGGAALSRTMKRCYLKRGDGFMPKKHFSIVCALFVVALCSPNAVALISETATLVTGGSMDFTSGSDVIATITSNVYSNVETPGYEDYQDKYVYTYQIENMSDSVLRYFSVKIPIGAGGDVLLPGYDTGNGWVAPMIWDVMQDELSIDAMFSASIPSGELSVLLYYASELPPTLALDGGSLVAVDNYVFATGPLNIPVPEPATMVLLSCGYLSIIFFRKKPV